MSEPEPEPEPESLTPCGTPHFLLRLHPTLRTSSLLASQVMTIIKSSGPSVGTYPDDKDLYTFIFEREFGATTE